MKKITIILALVSIFVWGNAQTNVNCYRIYLHDKQNSPYSVSQAANFLSQRCLDKRVRYNIPVTEEDFPVNPSYLSAIGQVSPQLRVLSTSRWMNTVTVWCPDTARMAAVRALSFVDSVKPVGFYASLERVVDTLLSPILGGELLATDLSEGYGLGTGQIALHNGQLLHNEGFRGEGMLIAMLDAGWDGFDTFPVFENLYANGQIVGTRNFVPGMDNVYLGRAHGTNCASIILSSFATVEDTLVGTAPHASMFFIRTEDPDYEQLIEEDFWVAGAELADSIGADVVTSSLGYTQFSDPEFVMDYSTCDGHTSIASKAATLAAHKGMVVCVAAGNEGSSEWHKLGRPSDAEDILCVGAVDVDTIPAFFSSCGPSYDGRVKPDVASCGWNGYVLAIFSHHADSISGDYTYYCVRQGSGTSFATPCVAGLAACLWQALPNLNSLEIMQIIREAGHQYNTPDTLMGYGVPNFYQAWLDHRHSGIQENVYETSTYSVYPNPCQNQFVLQNPDAYNINICIFDLSGKVVYAETGFSADVERKISTEKWQSGIYLMRVQNRVGGAEIVKIIRQ